MSVDPTYEELFRLAERMPELERNLYNASLAEACARKSLSARESLGTSTLAHCFAVGYGQAAVRKTSAATEQARKELDTNVEHLRGLLGGHDCGVIDTALASRSEAPGWATALVEPVALDGEDLSKLDRELAEIERRHRR